MKGIVNCFPHKKFLLLVLSQAMQSLRCNIFYVYFIEISRTDGQQQLNMSRFHGNRINMNLFIGFFLSRDFFLFYRIFFAVFLAEEQLIGETFCECLQNDFRMIKYVVFEIKFLSTNLKFVFNNQKTKKYIYERRDYNYPKTFLYFP